MPECTLYSAPEPEPIHNAPSPWITVAFEILVYCMTGCLIGWVFIH